VGDLHIKESILYRNATFKFLNWLLEKYKNETIIQLGDLFNSSSINHDIVNDTLNILKQFKDFRIISGNHDQSKRMSNILKSFNHQENITVYEKETEVEIENKKCLMLPYQYDTKYYSELTGTYDFIFTHITPKEESFGGEYTDISKLNGKKIYGHIHLKRDYPDAYIIGVPVITRNLEMNNPIIEITKDNQIKEIATPIFFNIVDLEYGQEMSNKDWLYNIKQAPSVKSVYEKYPAINIRDDGIEILYKSNGNEISLNSLENDLKFLFKTFCEEKEIEKVYQQEGITVLNECVV